MTDLWRVLAAPSERPAHFLLDLMNSLAEGSELLSDLREGSLSVTTQSCLIIYRPKRATSANRAQLIATVRFRESAG